MAVQSLKMPRAASEDMNAPWRGPGIGETLEDPNSKSEPKDGRGCGSNRYTRSERIRKKESIRLGCLFLRAHCIQLIRWKELPALRKGFLLSVNSLWKCPHQYA